jgi:hypothetical protein
MFDASDVKAVMAGTATRGTVMAVLTSQTCGEPCWHAREEICRCSCGGRNHGCLNDGTGERPERTAKSSGHLYRLKAVGHYRDICEEAREINRQAGYSSVDLPTLVVGSRCHGSKYTPADVAEARATGENVWFQQYTYTWRPTDDGAPARLKTASASQRKWKELEGWQDQREVSLLWERMEMPERPTTPVVDKETGEPLADQLPRHCHL